MNEEELLAVTAAISEYLKGKMIKIIRVEPSPWKYYGRITVMRGYP